MKDDHPKINFGKIGVLLINLGTPDSTSWWDIRKYLKEFLSDRRVIEVNPFIWQIILNTFILLFLISSIEIVLYHTFKVFVIFTWAVKHKIAKYFGKC